MRRWTAIFLLTALLSGCQEGGFKDYWNVHSLDYSDVGAAERLFADYAEQAVAAPEADALASLDVLFDKLKKDEVAYYLYSRWMDGAFYSLLSPCRNPALYAKAVERMVSDGIFAEDECVPFVRKSNWIRFNREGAPATLPGVALDGRRTLVLILDPGCPSCREALTALAAETEWVDVRRIAICCGLEPAPTVPGWDYYFPENAAEVFDPQLTPIWFSISADGTVETSYTLV